MSLNSQRRDTWVHASSYPNEDLRTIHDLITWLKKYPEGTKVRFEDGSIELSYSRPETDEEVLNRLDVQRRVEIRERDEYNRLKKKFG